MLIQERSSPMVDRLARTFLRMKTDSNLLGPAMTRLIEDHEADPAIKQCLDRYH